MEFAPTTDSTPVNSLKHQLMHYEKLQQAFNVNDMCSWRSICVQYNKKTDSVTLFCHF